MNDDSESFHISKEVLPSLEGFDFVETVLGDANGSLRQFRNTTGIHVKEYEDYFEIHKDQVDPRKDPLGHLFQDSPETILAFGAASILTRGSKEKSKHSYSSPLDFMILFFSLNRFFRFLKHLLF